MEMDNLQAPLISNRDPEDGEDGLDDGPEPGASAPAGTGSGHGLAGRSSPGLFMWLLTFSAGISGLLFGCTDPKHPATRPDANAYLLTMSAC